MEEYTNHDGSLSIIPLDMNFMDWIHNQYSFQSIKEKASELFASIVYSKPIKIELGRRVKVEASQLMLDYYEKWMKPLLDKMFIYSHMYGLMPYKVYPEKGTPFGVIRIPDPSEGQIFMLRKPGSCKTELIYSWHDGPLSKIEGTEKKGGKKMKVKDIFTLNGINSLKCDSKIKFWVTHEPRFIRDNTMMIISIITEFLSGHRVNCNFSEFDLSSAFTSPFIGVLPKLIHVIRSVETSMNINQDKLQKRVYIENNIPYSEREYDNYLKHSLVEKETNVEVNDELNDFISKKGNKKYTYDPNVVQYARNTMTSIYHKQNKLLEPLDSIDDNPRSKDPDIDNGQRNIDKAYENNKKLSRGIYNAPITTKRGEAIDGAPGQHFVMEPKYDSPDNLRATREYMDTIVADMFGVPEILKYSSSNTRVEINRMEREDLEHRTIQKSKKFESGLREMHKEIFGWVTKGFVKGIKNGKVPNAKIKDSDLKSFKSELESVKIQFDYTYNIKLSDLVELYSMNIPDAVRVSILERILDKYGIEVPKGFNLENDFKKVLEKGKFEKPKDLQNALDNYENSEEEDGDFVIEKSKSVNNEDENIEIEIDEKTKKEENKNKEKKRKEKPSKAKNVTKKKKE